MTSFLNPFSLWSVLLGFGMRTCVTKSSEIWSYLQLPFFICTTSHSSSRVLYEADSFIRDGEVIPSDLSNITNNSMASELQSLPQRYTVLLNVRFWLSEKLQWLRSLRLKMKTLRMIEGWLTRFMREFNCTLSWQAAVTQRTTCATVSM